MINSKQKILLALATVGFGLAFYFFYTKETEDTHPTAERFRAYLQENHPELSEKDDFKVSEIEFFTERIRSGRYLGADVLFEKEAPTSYTTFVLTRLADADLENMIAQFEKNQATWEYETYELDVVKQDSLNVCLVLIQNN